MPKRSSRRSPSPNKLSVQRASSGNAWVLSHPRAARDCAEDLEEVRSMIDAGEVDVAIDELRWLLGTCHDIIEAHFLLGKLAVEVDNDLPLGRGHFGTGYQLGLQSWRRANRPTPVPALHPANRYFFDAGRGLAWCLNELEKPDMAREVLQLLLQLDPTDPLSLAGWLDEMATAGKTVVDVGSLFQ
jgi:hypothetical protein